MVMGMMLRMNTQRGSCKILMGSIGNVFVLHYSTQVWLTSYDLLFYVFIKLQADAKRHWKSVFKTKAFIAKNALYMKKTIKSTTGHQYKTMYNDHMVESAGRGQCRAWLQWHKRPINILHNIEFYIYTFFFCFVFLTVLKQLDSESRWGMSFHAAPNVSIKFLFFFSQ